MEKRYFYKQAYLGNTEIFMYVDGKLTETNIINDYNLDGYTRRLRDEGYTFGYPSEEVERLKKEYEDAKEAVNNMITNKED